MQVPAEQNKKARILDACELVYAVEGIEALSLRNITARAGVNLAAINYHFKSKETLTTAMLKRHLAPIQAERLILLDLVQAALPERVRPTHIVAALILPTLAALSSPLLPPHFESFATRCASDPATIVRNSLKEAFGQVSSRIDAAFIASAKDMEASEAIWRSRAFFNNHLGTAINENTLSMIVTMLKADHVNVSEIIMRFGSVMECMMHRILKRDELRILTIEALEILKPTETFQTLSKRIRVFPDKANVSPFYILSD